MPVRPRGLTGAPDVSKKSVPSKDQRFSHPPGTARGSVGSAQPLGFFEMSLAKTTVWVKSTGL